MFGLGIAEMIILAAIPIIVIVVVTAILFGQAKNRDEQVGSEASGEEYPNRLTTRLPIRLVGSLDNGISTRIAAAHCTNLR